MIRYPDYKPSGIEWLGDIPSHWEVMPIKRFCTFNDESLSENVDPDTQILYVDISSVNVAQGITSYEEMTFKSAPSRARRIVRHGDIIISTVRTYLKAIAIVYNPPENLIVSTGFAVIRPNSGILSQTFAAYLFQCETFIQQVISYSVGVNYPAINASTLVSIRLQIPPLDEQAAIASYLDHELADIQELIAAQKAFLEGLREKRTALISQVVTQGLNPDIPMRDSSIEWLGEIPAHWEVRRNKSLFFEVDHRSTMGEEELLTVSHLTGVTPRSEKNVNMFMAETLEDYKLCQSGDLVINTMWGWMGAMGIARQVGAISPSYNVYRPRDPDSINPTYFDVLYRTPRHIAEIKRNSVGVWESRLRIYPEVFLSLFSPLPPPDEQAAIAEYIASATHQIDVLVNECYKTIDILHERRAALITAAVTGQIDVRSHVPIQS